MCDKRNQLITQAILSELSSGVEIYTAKDILIAANIDEKDLNEVLEQLQCNVGKITKGVKKHDKI